MGTQKNLKPGQKAPASGLYPVIGPRGGNSGREVTVTKGEPMPPPQKAGETYGKPDHLAKNGSGTGAAKRK
jgi:YjzC-like protein